MQTAEAGNEPRDNTHTEGTLNKLERKVWKLKPAPKVAQGKKLQRK